MNLKPVSFVVIVAILIAFILVVFPCKSAEKAYGRLEVGSTYNEVISIAGEPNYETDGTKWVEPQYDKSVDQLIEGCVREAWYENRFMLPGKYAFCFDENNVMLHKYHWVSW